ncbi:MAG TPA: hypothetical protein VN947_05340 [Polyangia bacterium]|nr:hypothetical protein [Polyangia bacterium]
MWPSFALVAIAASGPIVAASGPMVATVGLIAAPADARLVGSATIDEIRAFPELGRGMKTLPTRATAARVAGVDRIFEIDRPFADTVAWFDQAFTGGGQHIVSRVATPSATAWSVERPDGTVANAVVRNTTPTTIELAEVIAEPETKQLPLR